MSDVDERSAAMLGSAVTGHGAAILDVAERGGAEIAEELERASSALRCEADPLRWASLYAIQQSLQWVLNKNIAAAPVAVVLAGRVQVPTDIPVERAGCSADPRLAAS